MHSYGSYVKLIFFMPVADVYEMAFDWISRNYYFLDNGREMIFACVQTLDKCTSIIDVDISKPRGIALDPTKGYDVIKFRE